MRTANEDTDCRKRILFFNYLVTSSIIPGCPELQLLVLRAHSLRQDLGAKRGRGRVAASTGRRKVDLLLSRVQVEVGVEAVEEEGVARMGLREGGEREMVAGGVDGGISGPCLRTPIQRPKETADPNQTILVRVIPGCGRSIQCPPPSHRMERTSKPPTNPQILPFASSALNLFAYMHSGCAPIGHVMSAPSACERYISSMNVASAR